MVIPSMRRVGEATDAAKFQVVGDGGDVVEHLLQVAGDGDLLDGEGQLPVFNPQTGGAAGVIAGHHVDAESHQLRDIEAGFDVG